MSAGKFLQRVSLQRAREVLLELARSPGREIIRVEQALGRISAAGVRAQAPSPHYRAAAMDGIAVRSADTEKAASAPVRLRAVDAPASAPPAGSCMPIDTGGAVPAWADAVVRIEDVKPVGDGFELRAPVAPGRDVRSIGEDIDAGAALFARGHRIRPYDIGALLATGQTTVEVMRPPRIGILATGSEVVEPGADPEPGQVIEFNSRVLAAYAVEWGAMALYLGRVEDDPAVLARELRAAAATQDVVCVIAGSSAGRRDFTAEVLESTGELLVHGIDVMPGKPAAIARVADRPVIGIPGYPVSAVVVYRELVGPLVARMLGTAAQPAPTVRAEVRRRLPSRLGLEEFVRVCLAADAERLVVAPLPRGAGSIGTLVQADGLLRIPATCEGYDPGSMVEIELLPTGCRPGMTVVVAGRSDEVSGWLEDRLRTEEPGLRFAHLGLSAHDAVTALARGEAHLLVLELPASGTSAPGSGELLGNLGTCRIFEVAHPQTGASCRIVLSASADRFAAGARLLRMLESGSAAMLARPRTA